MLILPISVQIDGIAKWFDGLKMRLFAIQVCPMSWRDASNASRRKLCAAVVVHTRPLAEMSNDSILTALEKTGYRARNASL